MNTLKKIIIISVSIFLIQCKNDKAATTQKATVQQEFKNAEPLASVPIETMKNLFDNADYTDYIFHHLPFSMSQDEQASIRMNLSYISTEVNPHIPLSCKPIARQFYHIKGEIVIELDVYYEDNCAFYVFVENEKPVYSNKMSEAGKNFFKSSISQAMQARQ